MKIAAAIGLILVLAIIAFFIFINSSNKKDFAKNLDTARKSDLTSFKKALDAYKATHSSFPDTLDQLATDSSSKGPVNGKTAKGYIYSVSADKSSYSILTSFYNEALICQTSSQSSDFFNVQSSSDCTP